MAQIGLLLLVKSVGETADTVQPYFHHHYGVLHSSHSYSGADQPTKIVHGRRLIASEQGESLSDALWKSWTYVADPGNGLHRRFRESLLQRNCIGQTSFHESLLRRKPLIKRNAIASRGRDRFRGSEHPSEAARRAQARTRTPRGSGECSAS